MTTEPERLNAARYAAEISRLENQISELRRAVLEQKITHKPKVIQEVKGPTKPPVSLVDLEVAQAKSDARLANQKSVNGWTVRVVGISACGLVILEPISMIVSNYVASVAIGILSIMFLAFGWVIRVTIPEQREALQEKAEASIRYTHGVMDWEHYREEVAKQSADLDSRKQLDRGNSRSDDLNEE